MLLSHSVNNYWTITKYQHLVYARYGSGDMWTGVCRDGYKMAPTGYRMQVKSILCDGC